MTRQRTLKRQVRERMAKTGERYAAARRQVVARGAAGTPAPDGSTAAPAPAAEVAVDLTDRPADAKVVAATGRSWDAWFALLDDWGGRERTHRDTARFLRDVHGVAGWWSQAITMWYQRARGLRRKHEQPDGFTIYASRTVNVPAAEAFAAVVDARARRRWLTDGAMTLRSSQPGRVARFDWTGDTSRVEVTFAERGPAKTVVAVAHGRLADPAAAEQAKLLWRARLQTLASTLGPRPR